MDMLVESIEGTETLNVEEHKQRGSIKAIFCE